MITLSDDYDAKLKALVTEPFVDTRVSIVERLIDDELARRGITPNGNNHVQPAGGNGLHLNPDAPENLRHTKVLSARIDGRDLNRPKWNNVIDRLHILGLQRLGSFEALERASGARLRRGRFEDQGYKYISEADISIQGVAANPAWANSLRLARALRVPIELRIEWRVKDGAARPGETAVLEWAPTPG
jgi:hypothetical protein